jgi:hypothetical protein
MSYASAKEIDHAFIPVIDIAPLRDGTDPKSVADRLHQASQEAASSMFPITAFPIVSSNPPAKPRSISSVYRKKKNARWRSAASIADF